MKLEIKNRKNQKIIVLIEENPNQKGLSFVMHGLGGNKNSALIEDFRNSFYEKGFTVVRFDTTNTFGESDGDYSNATVSNYYEDLEDVIFWASKQDWYQEPFYLAGHSLGGISTALFAQKFPEKVKGLAPISTVISGKLSLEIKDAEEVKKWKETGWKESISFDGKVKRLKWSHFEDRNKYDLLKNVNKLTMPILMIVGSEDTSTPVEHQKTLFDALKCEKEIHIIEGAPHTFRDPEILKQIKEIFLNWIDKVER